MESGCFCLSPGFPPGGGEGPFGHLGGAFGRRPGPRPRRRPGLHGHAAAEAKKVAFQKKLDKREIGAIITHALGKSA